MRMNIKTMQEIDLTKEVCPINLVKFKYHFYELKSFICITKKGEASKGIINFLTHKNAIFEIEELEDFIKIKVMQS